MQMQTKLTNRDKFLLSLLAFVLIGVGFIYYLIMPALQRIDDLDLEIADAQIAQQEMKLKIASYPDYQKQMTDLAQTAYDETIDYYDLMSSQEVDREITSIVLANGLESVGLNIQPAVYTSAEPYGRSRLARADEQQEQLEAAAQALGLDADALDSQASGETDGSQEEPLPQRIEGTQNQIYTCSIRLTVEGSEDNYTRLIDSLVNTYPAIRVTSISYQQERTRRRVLSDGTTVMEEGVRQLVLGLDMYMCDKQLYRNEQAWEEQGNESD